jgi:hypothetical protein
VASKNGFLICNACNAFSLSHTSLTSLSSVSFPSLSSFHFSRSLLPVFFLFSLYIERAPRKTEGHCSLSKDSFSKVLCIDSLRYLQERLALQHLLPAMPSRSRDRARGRGNSKTSRASDIAHSEHRRATDRLILAASRRSRAMCLALLAA